MEDIMLLDEALREEERLSRDTVRRFVDEEVMGIMPEAYEIGRFPIELVSKMASLGLLGMTLPKKYGGIEAGYVTYGLICQELERGDSGLRSFVSVQSSLCMHPIFKYGTEEQKQRYLPGMAKGEIIGCFGLTEPDAGSDPSSMKTTAKKVKEGWLLNGSKMWITNAPIADIAIIWAKTDQGVRGFIVSKDSPGFKTSEITHKLSLRASSTGEIVMSDCLVPDDHFLPGTEKGLSSALSCLVQARFGVAWGAIGAAMACYETALDFTKERVQFNRKVASFQLVQKDLADMLTEITKAQCLNLQLGRLMEAGKGSVEMVSMAKMNACREALNVSRMARNLLGASGISLEYPIIRHMTNLESVFTYEGTDNVHHLILGKYITGHDAFC